MTIPRTLIIGLDGATFDLINPLIEAGDMPVLKSLIADGTHGPLETFPNSNSAAAWSSIVTGYNPGHHGIFHFNASLIGQDQSTAWNPSTSLHRRKDPFWRILSAAGQRVGVINVPISFPADRVNGFMLAGMDAPGLNSPGFAEPPDLLANLQRQGINYVLDAPNLREASRRNPHRLPVIVKRMIDARAKTILHLMQSEPWNVLMAVFVATDRVQHYFWPGDLSRLDQPDWIPIRSVYRQIDEFFGKALTLIDSNTTVLVVSDHGFGRVIPAKDTLNQLFAGLGLLHFTQRSLSVKSRLLKSLLRAGRRLLPYRLQDRLARAWPDLHLRAVNANARSIFDWSRTKVFASTRGSRIWINLKERSPEGIVSPDNFFALRDQVREIVLKIVDPVSGKPVVREVHRREDIYRGEFVDKAPDLLVQWNSNDINDRLEYSSGGRTIVMKPSVSDGSVNKWNGSHRSQGIFIARGPHIRAGFTMSDVKLYDIAPTVLYLQDHPIPIDSDGKVLTSMFTEKMARPVQRYEPTTQNPTGDSTELASDEASQIAERLRGLGYIE
jgi:predicted AlkP superfamily phosphohydrolase/phosphomutase